MTLYAARGGTAASDLYILDPNDASETSVGNTGRGITGLAFDPTSGILYGSTSNNSPLNARSLVTIVPGTGATTLVGSFGIAGDTLADIAFDSAGVLYGYSGGGHKLYTVNLGTGAATQVSATTLSSFGFAMDFDSEDNLFVFPDGDDLTPPSDIVYVDQTNASHMVFSHISGSPPYGNGAALSAGTFAPARTFYAIDNDFGASAHLVTINISTGDVVDIGSVTTGMDALASDTRATAAWIYTILATDVVNPAAATRYDGSAATVVSGRVNETWSQYWDFGVPPIVVEDWSLKWTWTRDAGQYQVLITGQMDTTPGTPNNSGVYALFRVNGKQIVSQRNSGSSPGSAASFNWKGFDGWLDAIYNIADLHDYPWLVLKPGDEVEVLFISTVSTTGTFLFVPFECQNMRFMPDDAAPTTTYCTPIWSWEDHPIGDAWGSPNGWGGQMLVPDQIWPIIGVTPYDESDFPWGINWTDFDFVALESGVCYVMIHDSVNVSDPSPPGNATQRQYVVVKKYDPGGDSWSQINRSDTGNDYWNEHVPSDRYRIEAVSCELGPDGMIYFAWWEQKTYTAGSPPQQQWAWHVVKFDPSSDTATELGTGQWVNTVNPTPYWVNYPESVLANMILPMANGDVYIANQEYGTGNPTFDIHCYVWRWNGSSWTNLSLPDPSLTNAGVFECNGENGFYDRVATMVAARYGEGPVTDGFTLVYPNTYFDSVDGFDRMVGITINYTVGSGWGTEMINDWSTLLYVDQSHGSIPIDPLFYSRLIAFDADILWSELLGRLVFVADHVGGGAGESWVMYQMNDAGTQWEPIETSAPSVSGAWRQSRNTSDFGPDGNVYRAMISEWNTAINFLPRVSKHSPGYGPGWSNAIRSEFGQLTNKDFPWAIFAFETTNYRVRIVGETMYILQASFAESGGYDFGEPETADAIWIGRAQYNPCSRFIYGDIKRP